MTGNPIILFDGICNLCNGAVTFIITRDKKSLVKFAALQSEPGRRLLAQFNLPANSFIFIEDGKAYLRSAAALKVCTYLSGLWPLLYGFIIVPPFIRDGVYRLIAKKRYKWFGKQAHCMVPAPGLQERFL